MPAESTLSQRLLDTASEVIIAGVEFGLDWAGEKALGSTGWSAFKQIMQPVVERLQKEFPALRFGIAKDVEADTAAREAVEHLKQDPVLRELLIDGFLNLKDGQKEILASIDRLEQLMRANQKEIIEHLVRMSGQLGRTGDLPTRVDVSGIVDNVRFFSNIRAKRERTKINEAVTILISNAAGAGWFMQRVLEDGKPFIRYEADIFGSNWFATPTATFPDEEGRLCRKLSTDHPVFGEPGKRVAVYEKYCQVEGYWRSVQLLESTVYASE